MVTTSDLGRLRRFNLGIRTLQDAVDVQGVAREIERYDPADAAIVSQQIRSTVDREAAVDAIVAIYEEPKSADLRAPSGTAVT